MTLRNRDVTLITDSTSAKQITLHGIEQQKCHPQGFPKRGIGRTQ